MCDQETPHIGDYDHVYPSGISSKNMTTVEASWARIPDCEKDKAQIYDIHASLIRKQQDVDNHAPAEGDSVSENQGLEAGMMTPKTGKFGSGNPDEISDGRETSPCLHFSAVPSGEGNLRNPEMNRARWLPCGMCVTWAVTSSPSGLSVLSVSDVSPHIREFGSCPLQVGDELIKVDGCAVPTPAAAPSMLWGEVGSKVKIEVRREGNCVVETDHVRRHSEADGRMVHYVNGAIMCGVGIVLGVDRIGESKRVLVRRVVDGPAAQAGIQSGDEVLSIEGVEAASCDTTGLMRLAALMVGPQGSIVTIEFDSRSRGGARTAALTRSIDTARAQWPEVGLKVALTLCGSGRELKVAGPGEEGEGKWWGEEECAFEAVRAGVVAAMGVSCERIKVAGVSRSRTADEDLGSGQGGSGCKETASLIVLPSLDASDSTSVWQLLDSLMSISQAASSHVVKLEGSTRAITGIHVVGWAKTPSEGRRRRKRFGAAGAGAEAGQVGVVSDGGGSASSSSPQLPPPRMIDVPPEDVPAAKSNRANFPAHPSRIGLLRMANVGDSAKLESESKGTPSASELRRRGSAEGSSAFSQSFQSSSRRASTQSVGSFSQSFHNSRRASYESVGTLSDSFKETKRGSFENASIPNSPQTPRVIRPVAIHVSSPGGVSRSESFVQRIALADIASQAQSLRGGSFKGRGLLDQTIQGEGGGSRRGSFKGRGIVDHANGGEAGIPPPFNLAPVLVAKAASFDAIDNQQALGTEVASRQHVETQENAGPPDTYRNLVVANGPIPPRRLLDHQPSISKSSPPPEESKNLPSPSKSVQNSMLEVVDVLGIEFASPQSLDAMPARREQEPSRSRSASVSTPRGGGGYPDHAPEDYPSSNHGGSSMMRQQQQRSLHHSLPLVQLSPPPPPSPESNFAMYDAGAKVPIIPISNHQIPKLELVGQDPTQAGGSSRSEMVADSRMLRRGSNGPFQEHQIAPAPQPIGGGGDRGVQARMSNSHRQSLSSPRPAAAAANYDVEL